MSPGLLLAPAVVAGGKPGPLAPFGSCRLTLVIAAPVRALLWLVTRERLYLYRTAETAGYFVECLWPRRPHAS